MKQEDIKQLLEKYWQGETSIEEEKQLHDFFLGNDIPEEWKKYRMLFVWKNKQKAITIDKKAAALPQKSIFVHLYPTLKMVASVLILLTVGIGFYTHYRQEQAMDKMFSKTAVDQEETPKGNEVMAKASSLQLSPENMISDEMFDSLEIQQKRLKDSLKPIEPQPDSLCQENPIEF